MLLASPEGALAAVGGLGAPGVRLQIIGMGTLRSALPLGFVPRGATAGPTPPVLLSGDPRGLEALTGLDAIYRTHSWVAPLAAGSLHRWQLGALAGRLRRAEAELLATNSGFSMTAPFGALDRARAQADAAPGRLWLAGGGAAAALVMFVVLAAGALRRDQALELERLRSLGARRSHAFAFVVIEAALLCGVAVLTGAVAGVAAAALLADVTGAPVGATLSHSLLTPGWIAVLGGTWVIGSGLLGAGAAIRGRVVDGLALAAASPLVLGLVVTAGGEDGGGGGALAVLVAPLGALAGGVVVFRVAAAALRGGERVARRGPLPVRLAFVSLARAPAAPALAAACLAVSVGLSGFALAYRATLLRGAADEAAQRVPLDGLIARGLDFTRPLDVASIASWRTRFGGTVWPVRRTDATYVAGAASVGIPALGVPAAVLPQIHGWRESDGSAPLRTLARRLVPEGPLRTAGPIVPARGRVLTLPVTAAGLTLEVTAVLRSRDGALRRVALGATQPARTTLRARLPAGRWELDGLELQESAGLEVTDGHQNGENIAAATQRSATVSIGPLDVRHTALTGWRGVGALSDVRARNGGVTARFDTSAVSGLLRPEQPSDRRAVPVLVGPGVPSAARLALSVDGYPVDARIVGTLRRFPTVDGGGFVVADEATLAAALDAQHPGEGASDELWQLGGHPAPPFDGLADVWRGDLERSLRSTPVAHAILGSMLAAAGLAAVLAVAGLLIALLGSMRDRRTDDDLVAQGLSPRGLRSELRLRLAVTSVFGVIAGSAIALGLTVFAVAAVRAGLGLDPPQPSLVPSTPWSELVVLALGVLGLCGLAGAIGSAARGGSR